MLGERVDKNHRITLRMKKNLFYDCKALGLNHDMSLNLLFNEMILFASKSGTFKDYLQKNFKIDERHGHFVRIRGDGT